jgi:5'-3' exonuclease
MKIHLIDGTFELFRAHFGAPSAMDSEGREVGATRGLLRSLAGLLSEPTVTHVAAAFDTVVESFRNQLFDGYKTGEGIEPELWRQFPLAERAAHALGIVVWPMVDFEADDALATAAAKWGDAAEVDQVLLCSPDKDLTQCVVANKIVCVDRMRRRTFDHDGVVDKFGVEPASIPDYLGLVGDAADGIPGIPRWGAKGAAAVLSHYRHVDDIPADPESWQVEVRGKKTLSANLNLQREDARLYVKLATLRRDVPLSESLDELCWRGARREYLTTLCDEIGMRSNFIERIRSWREDAE